MGLYSSPDYPNHIPNSHLLPDRTKTTIKEFNSCVSKLNQYNDRLILEAEKGCVLASHLRPTDEQLVIDTTEEAIKFILRYSELLDTIKEVETKKKTVSDVTYPEYVGLPGRNLILGISNDTRNILQKAQMMKTIENLKSDVVKLKLFQEYSSRTVGSLINGSKEDSAADISSMDNSHSFS